MVNEGVFLDTSALYAAFDAREASNQRASLAWRELVASDASLHISNYVVLELTVLLQRRLGVEAVDALHAFVLPWVQTLWIQTL